MQLWELDEFVSGPWRAFVGANLPTSFIAWDSKKLEGNSPVCSIDFAQQGWINDGFEELQSDSGFPARLQRARFLGSIQKQNRSKVR